MSDEEQPAWEGEHAPVGQPGDKSDGNSGIDSEGSVGQAGPEYSGSLEVRTGDVVDRVASWVTWPLDKVLDAAAPYNPRVMPADEMTALQASLKQFGALQPVIVNTRTGNCVGGHQRAVAAKRLGWKTFPVILVDMDEADEMEANLALNKISGHWDNPALAKVLLDIRSRRGEVNLATGFTTNEVDKLVERYREGAEEERKRVAYRSLASRFAVPPFSIFDARQGYWQDRKRTWMQLGVHDAEDGGDGLESRIHAGMEEINQRCQGGALLKTTHISGYEPVLGEILCRWFCPPGGTIVDPTAGGVTWGIVAAITGRRYYGIEIRKDQVVANDKRWDEVGRLVLDNGKPLVDNINHQPEWIHGDATKVSPELQEDMVDIDFILNCPPYHDLEKYSDQAGDLSNQASYGDFVVQLRMMYRHLIRKLKKNRFAAVVIGDIRDEQGRYRGLHHDIATLFREAGMHLYNDAVLVTAIGSLPFRTRRAFESSRKLGKAHQNVMVFVKGDPKLAAEAVGEIDVAAEPLPEEAE